MNDARISSSDIGSAIRRITLLTDFGTRDGYAAAMQGVITSIAPDARVIHATHDIPPGDVHAGAWALAMYSHLYPPGTIHVAIVDPGVGSSRRAIAARAGAQIFIAPDNGVLTRVLDLDAEIVEINAREYRRASVSPTFHGRDIFAPAAAHIARGIPLEQLGSRALGVIRLELPEPARSRTPVDSTSGARSNNADNETVIIEGDVVHIDQFGNLITNITAGMLMMLDTTESPDVPDAIEVIVDGRIARIMKSYSSVEPGALLAYIGSARVLEIGVRDGSAASVTGMQRGARVIVRHTGAAMES